MLIKEPSSNNYLSRLKNRLFKTSSRKRPVVFIFLILIIATGVFFSNRFIKTKGYTNIFDFAYSLSSNYINSIGVEPEQISIEIKDLDFQKLEQKRAAALERNLIINEEDSYVPALIHYQEREIKVKLRLKGHMTDHIQGDKWSFRVNVKGDADFMGMRLFSLQHPGTRQYTYEWVYHQLLKQEGVIALRYKFINVTINGKDLGIYAVEENFDKELIENNERPAGPVFRFNPHLYWVDRYNEILKDKVTAEFSSFSSSNFEAYREKKVLSNNDQFSHFLKGMALMEAFRRGELPADSVFDIGKQARFFAVMDLIGGHFSMDWSDIKFYYNPITSKLEPVGYEGCSLYPSKRLAGSYRYSPVQENSFQSDFHNNLFSDPVFFREYIRQVEKISDKAYLDNFFEGIEGELAVNLKIINSEFPYKKFDQALYYKNQNSIKKMLDTPKGFHAFFSGIENDSIQLQLGVIESLPVEITGILLHDSVISLPGEVIVLPAKKQNEYVNYREFSFGVAGLKLKQDELKNLSVKYRILGASHEKRVEVFPYPYKDKSWLSNDLLHQVSNVNDFNFLSVNEQEKIIYIKPGKWRINKHMIIPKGYVLKAQENTLLELSNSAGIISYSPIEFIGSEESPVTILSPDSSGREVVVLNADKKSLLKYVHFKNLSSRKERELNLTGILTFYESEVNIGNCYFTGGKSEDALNIIRSKFTIDKTVFENFLNDALDIKFSEGKITNCSFINCDEDAIDITSGNVVLTNITMSKIGNKGLNIKAHAEVHGTNIKMKQVNVGVSAEDMAIVVIDNIQVTGSKIGFIAYQNKPHFGPGTILATKVSASGNDQNYLIERNSKININGTIITDEAKNFKKLLKQYNDE